MNLKEKIGQLLFFGWSGDDTSDAQTINSHAKTLLEDFKVGGIVLMDRNIAGPKEVRLLNESLQNQSKKPLFIGLDQEGGLVTRIKSPVTVFPGNMALGATWSPKMARESCKAIGEEIHAMGFNLDIAPCVDVNINPKNPIIGIRSYGESPAMVSAMAIQAVKGFQESGIFCCAKHFPGHGDTSLDSHKKLPTVTGDWKRLDSVELRPFRAVIDANVDFVMTTHILFQCIDPETPATLSYKVITELLREKMGFQGLVITDCLEMKAIADHYGPGTAAVMAVKAGVDMVLACHTLSYQREMRDALLDAVKHKQISEDRIDQSVMRILEAKKRISLNNEDYPLDLVGCSSNQNLEKKIARSSLTVIRKLPSDISTNIKKNKPLLILGPDIPSQKLKSLFLEDGIASSDESELNTEVNYAACIALTQGDEDSETRIQKALEIGTKVIAVGIREPYEATKYPSSVAYIAAYGSENCTLKAIRDLLLGKFMASGKLPVSI